MPILGAIASSKTGWLQPFAPTIGTATGGNGQASITFTPSATGPAATSFVVTSSPGSFTASGASSPLVVTGLTNGTSYTFTVIARNASGDSTASSASNSVTPSTPAIALLGAWSSGAAIPGSDINNKWGWNLIGGTTPRVYNACNGRSSVVYYSDGRGGAWTTQNSHPQGGILAGSSRSLVPGNRFYTFGADTGAANTTFSTLDGTTWRTEANISYNASWSAGSYFTNGSSHYLIVSGYIEGNTASLGTVNTSTGTVSWAAYASYPILRWAGSAQRLTSKGITLNGYTDGWATASDKVYSTTGSGSWTSETATPNGSGYSSTFSLTGTNDTRVYWWNGTTLYSRTDSSGAWRTETSPTSMTGGWGTVDSSGTMYVATDTGKYQLVTNS
jgi:hypothetical protein